MVTFRNRRTPSGNCALIPVNTEAVRGWKPGIGDDSERPSLIASGGRSSVGRESSCRAMLRRSSGPLLGVRTSKPKHGRWSANKGTREAYSSRVITQPPRDPGQVSPMRRISGGAAVVVRGWESQLHGEGRQDVSCWAAEGFVNREGSR